MSKKPILFAKALSLETENPVLKKKSNSSKDIGELFKDAIQLAKKNRKAFNKVKHAIVSTGQFELAYSLRQIELITFPETKEVKKEKKNAENIKRLFNMLDINISPDVCWLIYTAIKEFDKKGGLFSIQDAVKIKLKKEEIFNEY